MREKVKRNRKIRKLHKQGLSYSEVGLLFGISKQMACKVDHRNHTGKYGFWRRLWHRIH